MPVALLSVYHKTGVVEFARELAGLGWSLLASGGTARTLAEAGVSVRDVATLVGDPILGHRVVTLSREIHAGLLARDTPEDRAELERLGIPFIDLVCVDLYPLEEEIARADSTLESVIEKTDIGGPTLLRAAAKGGRIVIGDPADRALVIAWLRGGSSDLSALVRALAAKAEFIAATYCLASARYLGEGQYDGILGEHAMACRYGENPWQTPAALYRTPGNDPLALHQFKLVAGAPPSYINFTDADRLLQTVIRIAATFDRNGLPVPHIAVAVKHGNACGAAVGSDINDVLWRMVSGDPLAILGGFVMVNFPVDEAVADVLLTCGMPRGQRRLLDGILAPAFTGPAVAMLKRKKDKCRCLANPALQPLSAGSLDSAPRFRYVRGGFLREPNYTYVLDLQDPQLEKLGYAPLTPEQRVGLLLAKAVADTSNSNTITLTRGGQLIGNAVGQQDRVGGCLLAVQRAKRSNHNPAGAVACSDSFFPFADGPKVLAEAGVKIILATSGSVCDDEVRRFCQENGVTLYLIPDAVGRGFFGH